MATLVLLVLLTSAAGFLAPRPAGACSCAELDPYTALSEYPAALVGTLVDVDGQLGAVFSSAADTIYRFEVETWVKGDLGHVVEIHSAGDGASCGIEVGVGNRAGIMVRVDGDEYHSSLCETIDADVLLAASKPLETGAEGPARFLLSARIGGFDFLTVNEAGGIVAGQHVSNLDPHPRVMQLSACPDSNLMAELWSDRLIIRDLMDLSVVDEIDLTTLGEDTWFSAARCMNSDASKVWVVGEHWSGSVSSFAIYDATDGLTMLHELPEGQATIGDHFAIVNGNQYERLSLLDYGTGEITTLHEIQREDDETYIAIASAATSPDGTLIAALEVDYAGTPESNLILYSPSGDEINRIGIDAEGWWVSWIDNTRIIIHTSQSDGSQSIARILASPELEPLVDLSEWAAYETVADGDLVYGQENGSLMKADLSTGVVTRVATYPVQYLGPIALLPEGHEIAPASTDAGIASTAATDTVPPLTAEAITVEADQSASTAAQVLVAALVLAGLVLLGIALRRRDLEQPAPDPS